MTETAIYWRRILVAFVVLTVVLGGVATPGIASQDVSVDEEVGPVDGAADADPENGTYTATVSTEANDRQVHSIVICDLSDGTITACAAYNNPPVTVSELVGETPEAVQEQLDGNAIGLVDLTIRDPQSGFFLVVTTVNNELPEESPIGNLLNPGYPITNPPVNLADPNGSVDPSVEQHQSDSPTATGGTVRLNDDVDVTVTPVLAPDQSVVRTTLLVSDGYNEHRVAVFGTDTGVYTVTDGPVNGTAVLSESTQHATFIVDLGGQPYIVSIGPDSGGSGDQPVAPYNEESGQEESTPTPTPDEQQDDSSSTPTPETEDTATPTPGGDQADDSTPTATPNETHQGESTPTATPAEQQQSETPTTPTSGGVQAAESTATQSTNETASSEDTRSQTNQPGFGVITALLALLAVALLARSKW